MNQIPGNTLEICAEWQGGIASQVRLRGDLDWSTHEKLEAEIVSLRDQGARQVVLDMAAVTYVDSAGLASLVRLRWKLWEFGGAVRLRNCQPSVRRALDVTHLSRLFDLETRSAA